MKNIIEKLKNNKKILFEIMAIFVIAVFCYSLSPKTFQNDTFYTVKIGELIKNNGIDMKDHFSWHENLPYTYPHWLYDLATYYIYNLAGWKGIYISVCILSITLGITIYEVNKKLTKNQVTSFIIAFGSMYMLKSYIAARAQLLTFIIFLIIIYCIEKFIENPKKIGYGIGIVLSSLIIANCHAAVWPFIFVLSLPYIAEYIICCYSDIVIYRKMSIFIKKLQLKNKKIKTEKANIINKELENLYAENEKRKNYRETTEPYKINMKKNNNTKWLIVVMILCALTGLLTPIGKTPYTYLYNTMKGNTTQNINEHLPLTLVENIPVMCSIVLVLAVLTFTKTKIRLADLFMIGGLTFLMFRSRRQSSMFVLIGSIILNRMVTNAIKLYGVNKLNSLLEDMLCGVGVISIIATSFYLSYKYTRLKKNDAYINAKTYPVQACDWILENLDVNNIKLYNEYNYGSYLLFRGIPVFIDSRADLYAPEFSKVEDDIFMDFINTSNIGKYYGSTFEKYGITHVILYKNAKISMLIDNADQEKYNKIYSDDNFVIYEISK